jgi:uncharacterized protein YggE
MQMIERPWGVATHGTASEKAAPDLARIRFKVVRLEQAPAAAFAAVNGAVRAVRQVLRDHGVPDSAVEGSRLDLTSQWDYGAERRFLGYQCQAAFAVESTDLDDIEQLLIDVVAAGAHEIDAVEFGVQAKADLQSRARAQAVAAARHKAESYAEAAGVRLGAVLHIDDVDTGQEPAFRAHATFKASSPEQDLTPGHVVVSAAVLVGFAIQP